MQRDDKTWILIPTIMVLFVGFVFFSFVQCSSLGKTAAQHEKEIIATCQEISMAGEYVDCLRREWDRVNDVPAWMKDK